jgi:uncharacterized small protein (TIGR04563 family)
MEVSQDLVFYSPAHTDPALVALDARNIGTVIRIQPLTNTVLSLAAPVSCLLVNRPHVVDLTGIQSAAPLLSEELAPKRGDRHDEPVRQQEAQVATLAAAAADRLIVDLVHEWAQIHPVRQAVRWFLSHRRRYLASLNDSLRGIIRCRRMPMAGSDKRKQSFYFPEKMLKEIMHEAMRQDRSLSWIVQRAWLTAREDLRRIPSTMEVVEDSEEGKGD